MKTFRYLSRVAILAGSLWGSAAQAQDIHFSQFYETSVLRNPALTGIFDGDYKVTFQYRNQWSSISKPFQTAMVTGETRIAVNDEVDDYISIGLQAGYDKAGSISLQTVQLLPSINYNKSLENDRNTYLSLGFTGGYVERSFDRTKMTFNNQYVNGGYDPLNDNGEQLASNKFSYFDLGAGVSLNSGAGLDNKIKYYLGFAGYHFTGAKNSFYNNSEMKLKMRWSGNAGMRWSLNPDYDVYFHANYAVQGAYNELLLSGMVGYNMYDQTQEVMLSLYAGLVYRVQDAIVPVIKINYQQVAFAVSYDINMSSLKKASNGRGGMEISAFLTGKKRNSYNRTKCPHL